MAAVTTEPTAEPTLKTGALGFVSSLVIGVASTARAEVPAPSEKAQLSSLGLSLVPSSAVAGAGSTGVVVADIDPEGIAAQAGGTFTCTGTVDGQPVTWWVHQDDDQGHMTVTSDRLLRLDALERTVATKVGADLRTPVTVDCQPAGRTVLRNTPGQEIDCTATRTADPTGPVRMTVTVDENGVTAYRVA